MIKAIVSDIEGTTSSLSFVKEVLFPYARQHMAEFVKQHADDAGVAALIEEVRTQAGAELTLEGVIEQLIQWIDQDRKVTPLKALQGLLWEAGYRNGDFNGHIYPDAREKLQAWHDQGIRLYIYSSGSVQAQKLLFAHTEYGDLNYLFNGYFDTKTGGKMEADSYRHIAEALQLPAAEILFLSDVEDELAAARVAGMQTLCLVRDEEPNAAATFAQVPDFTTIDLVAIGKSPQGST